MDLNHLTSKDKMKTTYLETKLNSHSFLNIKVSVSVSGEYVRKKEKEYLCFEDTEVVKLLFRIRTSRLFGKE